MLMGMDCLVRHCANARTFIKVGNDIFAEKRPMLMPHKPGYHAGARCNQIGKGSPKGQPKLGTLAADDAHHTSGQNGTCGTHA